MSHFSTIKTQMVESAYLSAALRDLGYRVEEGDLKLGGFMDQTRPVEFRVRSSRWGYAIGFQKVAGRYQVVADWWGVRGVQKDEFVQKVLQRYAYRAAVARLEQQGFSLATEATEEDGTIRLVLRRMA